MAADDSEGCSSSDDDAPIPAASTSNTTSKKKLEVQSANANELGAGGEVTSQGCSPTGSPKKPAEASMSNVTTPLASPGANASSVSASNARNKLMAQSSATMSPTEKESKSESKSLKGGIIIGNRKKLI